MVQLSINRIFRVHCGVIAAVLVCHLLSGFVAFLLRRHTDLGYAFYVMEETSVPTVVSVAALLATAAVAWMIAAHARVNGSSLRKSWVFVAACLTFMAIDEGAALHDRLAIPFSLTGMFYIGWILPMLVLAIIVGVLCLPLIQALPRRTSMRLVIAGAVFVGSAIGLEMGESVLMSSMVPEGTALGDIDSKTLWTILNLPLMFTLITIEEIGEMVAAALALRALLLHLVVDLGVSSIRIGEGHAFAVRPVVGPAAATLKRQ